MAWTIDDGCTTTSIRSYGTPNRKCASISSSPLLASVAESTVIFGPIDHVGCASASSTVISSVCRRSALQPRKGPPDAVSTYPTGVDGRAASTSWKSAECSLSTGISSPRPRRLRLEREVAAGDEALLVRKREPEPSLERPERRAQSGEADDRVQHDVRLGPLEQLDRVAADRLVAARPRRRAASMRTRRRRARAAGRRRSRRASGGRSSRSLRGLRSAFSPRQSRSVPPP